MPSRSSSSLTVISLLRKINTKILCSYIFNEYVIFRSMNKTTFNSYCVIIDLYEWTSSSSSSSNSKTNTNFVFIHIYEICYFRVEIPFGSKERFLADPISLAPSSLASDWKNAFFFLSLFLSYSRISLIWWLDEFFAAWKNKV